MPPAVEYIGRGTIFKAMVSALEQDKLHHPVLTIDYSAKSRAVRLIFVPCKNRHRHGEREPLQGIAGGRDGKGMGELVSVSCHWARSGQHQCCSASVAPTHDIHSIRNRQPIVD